MLKTTAGRRAGFVLLVVVATAAAYAPALQGGFVWDDDVHIVANETLQAEGGLARIWLDPRANTQYYPLVFTTFWIERALWGLEPAGYHALNVLLHVANALLLWRLLAGLSLPGARLAALLFALHPVHVESVAWIMERKNLLSGMFYLLSALAFLRFRPLGEARRLGPQRLYWLALLLFVCALLSKSVTASLPAAILLAIYWKTGRVEGRDVVLVLPFFVLGIAAGLNTAWLEKSAVGAAGADWSFSPIERVLIAGRALCFYPAKLLWPEPLIFTYPRWTIDASAASQYLYPAAVAGVLALLWSARGRIGRGPLVAALFFAGTLVPALGFVDVYPMRFSFVADHFQYLASLGVLVPLAAGAAELAATIDARAGRWPLRLYRAAVGLVIVTLAVQTNLQSRIYRNQETLWRDTLAKNPASWMAHNNLGHLHGQRGDHERAAHHFRHTTELKPDYTVAAVNLGEALVRLGRHEEAVPHLEQALERTPDQDNAHYVLWVAYSHLGRWDEAMTHLRSGGAQQWGFDTQLEAARVLVRAGRLRDALTPLSRAARLRPDDATVAFERGNVHLALGEPEQAIRAYRLAMALHGEWAVAHARLGNAFERLGDPARAEHHYAEAVRLDPALEVPRQRLEALREQQGAGASGARGG